MFDNKFKIKLEMLSDWQIGTGAGIPGSTDKLVSRDADGFPQVPAKTLIGIWRDALEVLTLGLDNGIQQGDWSKWVKVIFGSQPNVDKIPHYKPVPAILSIQPARISENLRAKIGDDQRLKQALTFTKVGVKIDPDSGTSETEALRFEEMGRIGTVLHADFELDWNYFTEEQKEIALSLLVLSAKLVERIGGRRRRGAGKCSFKVFDKTNSEKTVIDAKTKIEANKAGKIEIPKKPTEEIENITKIEESQEKDIWQTCEYTLTLETPVSIVTAVLGNVSQTLDFIPGTYLISHFVKHFGQAIFEAIQDNNFQISPATICIDGNRSFPVPKVFAQEKMKKDKVYNCLLESLEGKEQTKPIREGYVSDLTSNKVSHATTPQTILMHNAVDDEVQRPTTDVVGIYSREAIQAGTILKGEIRFRNLDISFSNMNEKVRIGTSKKDGGIAEIKFETAKKFEPKSLVNNNKLIVFLASDVMLRNRNLRQTNLVEDLKTELEKTIGNGILKSYDELLAETRKNLQENKNDQGAQDYLEKRKDLISSIIQVRRIESWQVGWGFPRPTLTLIQAGSVVVFEIQNYGNLSETEKKKFKDNLQNLEKTGIGERRGEGYGQVVFNPTVLNQKLPEWETIKKKDFIQRNKCNKKIQKSNEEIQKQFAEEIKNDRSLNSFAKIIEETTWREEIKLAVSKFAADENLRKKIFGFEIERDINGKVTKATPPMSQIGGLRSVVMRLQKIEDKQLVIEWLGHLKDTNNRIEKWDKGKNITKAKELVDNNLITLFSTPEKVWQILSETKIDEVNVWQPPKILVKTKDDLQRKLWAEAVKMLFYACQQTHKRNTEDK